MSLLTWVWTENFIGEGRVLVNYSSWESTQCHQINRMHVVVALWDSYKCSDISMKLFARCSELSSWFLRHICISHFIAIKLLIGVTTGNLKRPLCLDTMLLSVVQGRKWIIIFSKNLCGNKLMGLGRNPDTPQVNSKYQLYCEKN